MTISRSILYGSVLAFGVFLLQSFVMANRLLRPFEGWEFLSVLFLVAFLSGKLILTLNQKFNQPKERIFISLVAVGFKMFLHLIIILIYFFPNKGLSVSFVISFLSYLLFFTSLDLYLMFKKT